MSTFLRNLARVVIDNCAQAYDIPAHGQAMANAQMFCLGEEAGEALGAWRRWNGWARRAGTQAAFEEEVADTVIAAYCVAEATGFDLDAAIALKADRIVTRGWKEAPVPQDVPTAWERCADAGDHPEHDWPGMWSPRRSRCWGTGDSEPPSMRPGDALYQP